MASLRSANRQRLEFPLFSASWCRWLHHPRAVAHSHEMCKKVAESFGGSDFFRTFATMKQQQYVITGISRLTGTREVISRPMAHQEAEDRLRIERNSRRTRKQSAYTRLRVERVQPIQLTFKFQDDE